MVSDLVVERQDVDSPTRTPFYDSERAAAITFALIVAAGLFRYVAAAQKVWFFGDEWDFLAGRGFNIDDLLRQHGGHLVALPVAIFRGLYFAIGLRSYLPYQLMTIGLHLTAAVLLRAIMRRAGVHSWIATIAAGTFVLFGSAGQNILWAFQITFVGPLVLGLVHLLLADHDGPIDRRDWIGLLAGCAALLCSGVAVALVGVVGLAAVLRRGWRAATFHTVPLALVYAAWWLRYARSASTTVTDPSVIFEWVHIGIGAAFDALGQVPFVGWALAIMLISGLVVAVRQSDLAELRCRGAVTGAMLVGSIAFLLFSGANRAWAGTRFASSSRYLHIVVALLLPALALAADALVRRWRALVPVVLVLLVIGVPGNIGAVDDSFFSETYFTNYEAMVRSIPRVGLARRVPRDLRPEPVSGPWITVGWLLQGANSGRIPAIAQPTLVQQATIRLRLSLEQLDEGTGVNCQLVTAPITRHVEPGESFIVRGAVLVQLFGDDGVPASSPITMGASLVKVGARDHTLRNVAGPLDVRIMTGGPGGMLCEAAR
jgi:hypothetical protein